MVVIFPSFWNPIDHYLDLITRTPFIHCIFKYSALLQSYFTILEERGDDALWYRRQDEHPLPFEKGYSINGTGAMKFHKLVRDNWYIITDGFKAKKPKQKHYSGHTDKLHESIKNTFFREMLPTAYVLQKK